MRKSRQYSTLEAILSSTHTRTKSSFAGDKPSSVLVDLAASQLGEMLQNDPQLFKNRRRANNKSMSLLTKEREREDAMLKKIGSLSTLKEDTSCTLGLNPKRKRECMSLFKERLPELKNVRDFMHVIDNPNFCEFTSKIFKQNNSNLVIYRDNYLTLHNDRRQNYIKALEDKVIFFNIDILKNYTILTIDIDYIGKKPEDKLIVLTSYKNQFPNLDDYDLKYLIKSKVVINAPRGFPSDSIFFSLKSSTQIIASLIVGFSGYQDFDLRVKQRSKQISIQKRVSTAQKFMQHLSKGKEDFDFQKEFRRLRKEKMSKAYLLSGGINFIQRNKSINGQIKLFAVARERTQQLDSRIESIQKKRDFFLEDTQQRKVFALEKKELLKNARLMLSDIATSEKKVEFFYKEWINSITLLNIMKHLRSMVTLERQERFLIRKVLAAMHMFVKKFHEIKQEKGDNYSERLFSDSCLSTTLYCSQIAQRVRQRSKQNLGKLFKEYKIKASIFCRFRRCERIMIKACDSMIDSSRLVRSFELHIRNSYRNIYENVVDQMSYQMEDSAHLILIRNLIKEKLPREVINILKEIHFQMVKSLLSSLKKMNLPASRIVFRGLMRTEEKFEAPEYTESVSTDFEGHSFIDPQSKSFTYPKLTDFNFSEIMSSLIKKRIEEELEERRKKKEKKNK